MLSFQTILPHTLELLKQIMSIPLFGSLRLVGGTALALQYGHRTSIDLDFFGDLEGNTEVVTKELDPIGEIVRGACSQNIKTFRIDGVKIDFVNYSRYPWIDDPVVEDGICLASPKDIAAMKINAVMGRGSRKDFVDIYFLLQHYSIDEILDFYQQKYSEASIFRALLSLTYFNDAEPQSMPEMLEDVEWDEIKQTILEAVKDFNDRNV